MFDDLRILAVVPARGGSKSLPRKNIRPLAGEPLIGHTLRTAADVSAIDLLIVSTDDVEIAAVAAGYGVRVVQRPVALASDTAPTEAALLHAMDVLEVEGARFDMLLVLEPTSPFRSGDTIARAIAACAAGPVPTVLAVRETRENVGLIRDGCFRSVVPGAPRRRQERQPLYVESSTIYACRTEFLRRTGTLVAEDWGALVVSEVEAFDINTEFDFQLVEFLMQKRRLAQNV